METGTVSAWNFEGCPTSTPRRTLTSSTICPSRWSRGPFHCIMGVSGCGKSTIFRMTNGLLQPKGGGIIRVAGPHWGRKRYCGYMPQKDLLFPWRTVGENVALPLEIAGGCPRPSGGSRRRRLWRTWGWRAALGQNAGELSGGMRQRAAFARTMLTGSDLLLLDEPFSALDFLTRISMQEWLLDQWQRHKKTILFITHDVEEAVFLSSSVLVVESTPIHTPDGDPGARPFPGTGPVCPAGNGGTEGAAHHAAEKAGGGMKKACKANLPALIFLLGPADPLAGGGHGHERRLHPAHTRPDPAADVELREPLFTVHLPATMTVTAVGLVISLVLGLGPGGGHGCQRHGAADALPRGGGLPDHPHHRHCPPLRAVVRLRHLEQGAGDGAHHLFPHHHHGV